MDSAAAGQPAHSPSETEAHTATEARGDSPTAHVAATRIVGLGASAGGLDALSRFFDALPADSGAAFVVVQHLSPDYPSMMAELLGRHTRMPVQLAIQDVELQPNHVYLIPPGKALRLSGERLQVSGRTAGAMPLAIDEFFTSLAEEVGERALALVMSGTGSDGSRGIVAVNAHGGLVFVQTPSSAGFDGMPRAALATGLCDAEGTPAELAAAVLRHCEVPRTMPVAEQSPATLREPLEAILDLLLQASGVDFGVYKSNTVLRRIERRLSLLRLPSLHAYLTVLEQSADELATLRRELLIPVTRFFRDAEVFEQLERQVAQSLLLREHEAPAEALRVWVAGCATGEEAYSLAILFAEAQRRLGSQRPVKIFATDLEQHYLDFAAAGRYSESIAAEVTPTRLERWFTHHQGGYTVKPELRQMVIFARHNLLVDPPFTRMDLVSCRNVLIYFLPQGQERVLGSLQFALRTGGYLLLGPSENLGPIHRNFATLPGRQRIHQMLRRDRVGVDLRVSGRHEPTLGSGRPLPSPPTSSTARWVERGLQHLLSTYLPPSLLVGPNRELLHVYGSAGELLSLGEGQVTLDIGKLLPREVGWSATLLLQTLPSTAGAEQAAPVTVQRGQEAVRLRLVARRLPPDPYTPDSTQATALALLTFEPIGTSTISAPEVPLDAAQRSRVEELERELGQTHESLQATIEELETTNEELQATNEELMASNEELQSTNEELQSVNEELHTVNAEFQDKVDVLNAINADLENVTKATAIATLFVDADLRLLRFTPEAVLLFKVREGDRGRSLEDFAHTLDFPDLFSELRRTLREGLATEHEVRSRDGSWWLARLQPYTLHAPDERRAVISFVNISTLKDNQHIQTVLDSLPEHLAVLDSHGTIVRTNEAWRRFAMANGDPALTRTGVGTNYLSVCSTSAALDDDGRRAHEGLREVLMGRSERFTFQYPCHTPAGERWFLMHAAPLRQETGGAVVSHIDITSWVRGTLQPETRDAT